MSPTRPAPSPQPGVPVPADPHAAWRILVDENARPVIVFAADTLAVLVANDAAAALYGHSREELAARPITALAAPDGAEAWADALGRRAVGRWSHGPYLHETRARTPLQVEVVVHELSIGNTDARLAVLTDVTEQLALQGQLRQAQKMGALGQLAGSVAHDFNNLLAAILTSADLAAETLDADHPVREDLAVISRAGRRATELTGQLLAVSRKRPPKAELIDLNLLIAGPLQLLRRLVGADIELVSRLTTPMWPVRADPGQLEQVLLNLAVNARDAMPRGGTLTISTANRAVHAPPPNHPGLPAGEYALLSVADTGVGMDAVTLARVFEPFFTTKPPERGTGLGLSTAYGIVKQWGGYVYAESAPGAGSTFSLLLPRTGEEEERKPPGRPRVPASVCGPSSPTTTR